jgi:hypothetical protein
VATTNLEAFHLYASHHQFIVQDAVLAVEGDYGVWRDPETMRRGLAVCSEHELAVGTTSYGDVSVQVQLTEAEPPPPVADWQHAAEATLTVDSGSLLFVTVANAGEDSAPSLPLDTGTYRVRVMRKGLETVDVVTETGNEEVLIILWRAPVKPPELLREHPHSLP